MKNNRTMLERVFAVVLCLVLLVGLVPAGSLRVYAAEEDTAVTALGTVTAVTDGLEVFNADANGAVLVDNADETIVLEWCPADESMGRYSDGWWAGVKVTAPEGYSEDATFNYIRHKGETSEGLSFAEHVDPDAEDASMTMFALITGELLEAGEDITYSLELDWDADDTIDQTVNLVIHPENVVLLAEGSARVEAVTEGLKLSYETAEVSVTNSQAITLDYAEQDLDIGRYTDGWWVGVKVTAPEDYVSGATFDYHRHNGQVSEGLSFDDHVDPDADAASMTMFALVTEDLLVAGADIVYTLVLDWEDDGQDDLTVELTLDPGKIILLDANGDRAYPKYATVTNDDFSSDKITVDGANSSETVLTISNVEIPYDETKGGWFVYATVTPPLGCTNGTVTKATEYELNLTPAADNGLDKYENISGDIYGDFTWDGVAQKMTLKAANVTLLKADQSAVSFEGSNPADQLLYTGYGWDYQLNSYTRKASGGTTDSAIVYTSSDESIATVDQNGKVSFKNVGTVTITATKAGNKFYKKTEASYSLTIVRDQWGLNFTNSNPGDFVFGTDDNKFANPAFYQEFGQTSSNGITYSISQYEATGEDKSVKVAEVDSNGNLTIYHTGTVTVKAVKAGDRNHDEAVKTYTLTIVPGAQNLTFAEANQTTITYSPNETKSYTYTVEGIEGTGELTITNSNGDVAAEETKGNVITVTPKASGSFTLVASVAADDNYNAGEVQITVQILTEQVNMAFEEPNGDTVTYNDNGNLYTNAIVGAEGDGLLTYTSSDNSVATANNDGTVTIHKVSDDENVSEVTITITATKAANASYAGETLSYDLTIKKDQQDITLAAAATESNTAYTYTVAPLTGEHFANTKYAFGYTYGEGGYLRDTAVDQNGIVTIGKGEYGTVTVTVKRPGDACYEAWSGSLDLTITEMVINNASFTISEATGNNGWYKSDAEIQYKEQDVIYNLAACVPGENGALHTHGNEGGTYTLSDGVYDAVRLCVFNANGGKHDVNVCDTFGTIKVDTTQPEDGGVEYSTSLLGSIIQGISGGYYQAKVTATISASDATSGIAAIYYNLDGSENYEVKTFDGESSASMDITLPDKYKGQVKYYIVDMAGNSTGDVNNPVAGDEIIVDAVKPEISVSWSEAKRVVDENNSDVAAYDYASNIQNNTLYYQDTAQATITITEENFFNGVGEGAGKGVLIYDNGKQIAADNQDWVAGENNTWTNTVTFNDEGEHVLKVEFTDRSGNEMDTYISESIVIDNTAPKISVKGLDEVNQNDKITIEIKEKNFRESDVVLTVDATEIQNDQVNTYTTSMWTSDGDKHVMTVEFNADANFSVKVEYTDLAMHSDVEPDSSTHDFYVDKIGPDSQIAYGDSVWGAVTEALTFGYYNAPMTVTITASDAVSGVKEIRYNYDGHWNSAAPDADGKISFSIAPQYRGQVSYYAVDDAGNAGKETTANMTVIVDTVAPVISVEWPAAKRVVNAEGKDVAEYDRTSVSSGHKLYYQGSVTANIIINEANFFNGESTSVNGTNVEGIKLYNAAGEAVELDETEWTSVADQPGVWVNSVTFEKEAEHVLTIEYTDRSSNEMVKYVSDTIIIDGTAPVIELNPYYDERIYTFELEEAQATLTIEEVNFRASDVELTVEAVSGNGDLIVTDPVDYNAYAKDAANWTPTENGYKLALPFTVDANYTLDVAYTDLATNADDAERSHKHSEFTLDRVAPDDLSVSFSDNDVTDGYYGAAATATLSATDGISGIAYYSYVAGGTIEGTTEGSFTINPQFNGSVTFTAYDMAGNSTTLKDSKNIVVDSIAPTCNVTFSTPHQTVDEVAYYAENILVTINITETNFFSADYAVSVTKDGIAYPVNVAWNGNVGTFSLTEDGDYVVSVTGEDRSGNTMTPYASHILTLDTEAPSIKVSNIVANSANKDEEYTFDIEISDINLNIRVMNPVLTAVIKDDKGSYTTQEIQMTAPAVVEQNRIYRYTVENLTEDALYTLVCTALDLSGNEMKQILLEDEKLYDEVQFSINRSGSAFGYGDDYAEQLMNQYYVYSVEQDVVLVEVNVDPIESYVVLLNGQELVEGEDYTSVQSSEPGEWSKRQYIIHKDLFESEGEYSIIIHSTDKAETPAYSDVKDLSTSFVVDQTAPVITITGLETGGRYLTQEQTVTLIPTDEGGRLNSLKVVVLDSEGQPLTDESGNDISLRFEMSGEELLTYLEENDGMVTFTVPEGLNNQVQIICNDCAVNTLGQTNEYNEIFERVTVSQNQLVIFFANKPLFYGVIAGILGLIILIILLLKRKKKDEEEGK